MIQFLRGVFETRANVIRFEIGIVFENLRLGHPGGQQVEHVLDANAHPTDARPSAALVGIEGDTFRKLHVRYVAPWVAFRKQGFIRVVVLSSGRPWRRRPAPCRAGRRSPYCNGTPRLKDGKTDLRRLFERAQEVCRECPCFRAGPPTGSWPSAAARRPCAKPKRPK